jgi:hypothetical protein
VLAVSVEALCESLRERYARIGQLAEQARGRLEGDEPAQEILAALGELARETAALHQALPLAPAGAPEAGRMLDEARQAIERVHDAADEAARSLKRIGDRLDESIQGRKGYQAYRTMSPGAAGPQQP